jgi:hypothetical protein
MGNAQTVQPPAITAEPNLSSKLKHGFEHLWEDRDNYMTMSEFTGRFDGLQNVARIVFTYLSLNNPSIEKEFMEKRLEDISRDITGPRHSFVAAPWQTLVETIGLGVQEVLQVATRSSDMGWTSELTSIVELIERFPTLEKQFNDSIEDFISEPEKWACPISEILLGTLSVSQQRLLRMMVPSLEMEKCTRLFSFIQQGASFRALLASIKFYPGELAFVVKDVENRLFGIYCRRNSWEETLDKFDETARECIIFQLYPQLRIRRVNQRGSSNCVYLNVSNPNHPIGLGFGGQESAFRFFIDGNDVCSIKSMNFDATFEPGQVLTCLNGIEGVIETRALSMEVYGFGGSEALDVLQSRKVAEQDIRMSRKKVDRLRMVQNEFNKEMFFSKTFKQGGKEPDRLGS